MEYPARITPNSREAPDAAKKNGMRAALSDERSDEMLGPARYERARPVLTGGFLGAGARPARIAASSPPRSA